jgi:hypothetical protein
MHLQQQQQEQDVHAKYACLPQLVLDVSSRLVHTSSTVSLTGHMLSARLRIAALHHIACVQSRYKHGNLVEVCA